MDVEDNGSQETPDDADVDALKINPNKWTVCIHELLSSLLFYLLFRSFEPSLLNIFSRYPLSFVNPVLACLMCKSSAHIINAYYFAIITFKSIFLEFFLRLVGHQYT